MNLTRAKFLLACVACLSASALAPACSEEPPPAVQDPNVQVAKAPPPKVAEVVADTNTTVTFMYTPVGKRDPFRSYLSELAEQQADNSGPSRKKEETEEYEIDQYRLTGLITGTAQPKAMVEDPAGRGHVLRIGTRLGKNGGRVTRIANFGIIVVEETRDPTGKRIKLPIAIKLPRSEFEDIVQK